MPNRIIKESICTSDTIDQLSWFEEVFFYRLIVNCDDYGRFDARTPILKARLFPLKSVTEKQISDALNKLSTVGIVTVYEYDGRPYLQLVTWDKHQQIRAKKSKYPAPDVACNHMISDDIKCPRNPIQSEYESKSESNTNTNTSARKHSQPEKVQFAENVSMTNAEYEKLVSTYGEADVTRMIEKLDNYKGATGKKYKSDYRAILNWVADEILKQKNKDNQEPKSWNTLRHLYQKYEAEERQERSDCL
mgnify:CR=1 FL=1